MSSFVKTLPRWYWTVRGLRNSRVPIWGFDSPSRASRAIWASWGVSSVAVRLGHDLIAHSRVHRPGQRRVQQRACVLLRQPADRQLRQTRQLGAVEAGAEHHAHRLRDQAARHERQYLRGGPVEPLGVVDQADQRPLAGCLGQ